MKVIAALDRLTRLLYPGLDTAPVVAELRERILEELDYRQEAAHQRAFHALFDGHPFIRVPRLHDDYCTPHVLTMEHVAGRTFEQVVADPPPARRRWGEIIYRFVLGNILRHRLFNGDPHPGNYLFDDEGRVAFLDYGCVKRFPQQMWSTWCDLIRAHLAGDRARFRRLAVALGFLRDDDATLDEDRVFDYFGYFYEPFDVDREFTFTSEYTRRSFRMIFAPDGRFSGMARHMNMPRDFVFVNRIHWGVYSILARLDAAGNFHRIHHEYLDDGPPATELGEAERAYRDAAGSAATAQQLPAMASG